MLFRLLLAQGLLLLTSAQSPQTELATAVLQLWSSYSVQQRIAVVHSANYVTEQAVDGRAVTQALALLKPADVELLSFPIDPREGETIELACAKLFGDKPTAILVLAASPVEATAISCLLGRTAFRPTFPNVFAFAVADVDSALRELLAPSRALLEGALVLQAAAVAPSGASDYELSAVSGAQGAATGPSVGEYHANASSWTIPGTIAIAGPSTTIALLVRMTSASGVALDPWIQNTASALLAVQHFNERDDSVLSVLGSESVYLSGCDARLQPFLYDTESSPGATLRGFLQANSRYSVDAVVGAARSACTTPLALVASELSKFVISYWSTSEALSDRATYPTFARTIPSDRGVVTNLVSLWKLPRFDYKHIGLLYVDDPYGKSCEELLKEVCLDQGVKLRSEPFDFGDAASIANALLALKERAPYQRAFVAVVFDEDVPALVDGIAQAGLHGPSYLWFFFDSLAVDRLSTLSDERAKVLEGSLRISSVGGSSKNQGWRNLTRYWAEPAPSAKAFVDSELAAVVGSSHNISSGLGEDASSLFDVAAFTYDAVVALGLSSCAQRRKVVCCNTSNAVWYCPDCDCSDRSRDEVTPIPDGRTCYAPPAIVRTKKERKRFVAEYAATMELSFTGTSGEVEFDAATGSRLGSTATFELTNFVGKDSTPPQRLVAGRYGSAGWQFDAETPIVFPGGRATPPADIQPPPQDMNYLSSGSSAVGYFFFTVVNLICILLGTWVVACRTHPVCRASQWPFMFAIVCGCFLMNIDVLLFGLEDRATVLDLNVNLDRICSSTMWLFFLGFSISLSALTAKVYRVAVLFNNTKLRRIQITDADLAKRAAVPFILTAALCTAIQVKDPLIWERKVTLTSYLGDPIASIGRCSMEGGRGTIVLYSFLIGIQIGMVLFGVWMMLKARNADKKYYEGKELTNAMVSLFQIMLVGLPLLGMNLDNKAPFFFLEVVTITITNFALLLPLFVPKVISWWKGENITQRVREFVSEGSMRAVTTPKAEENGAAPAEVAVELVHHVPAINKV